MCICPYIYGYMKAGWEGSCRGLCAILGTYLLYHPPFFLVECQLSRPNIFLAVSVVQPKVGKLCVVGEIRAGVYVRCWRHLPPA